MAIDAIRQVHEAEARAESLRKSSAAEAKEILAEAEREGLALLERVRAESEAEVSLIISSEDAAAAARSAETIRAAEDAAAALKAKAESRLDAAAKLIVERIVNA